MESGVSVFIAESVSDEDFYERRADGHAANEVLKLRGQRTEYRVVITEELLKRAIEEAVEGGFDVFHFSSHGNDEGVSLTDRTWLSWLRFARLIKPFADPDRHLVVSSCQGGHAGLTKALEKTGAVFATVFGSTAPAVHFTESCLAWSILYNRLADHGYERAQLKKTLDVVNSAVEGDFVYRRWTGTAYRRYPVPKS